MRHVAVVIYQLHSEFAYKVGFATVACVEKGLVRLYRIFMKKKMRLLFGDSTSELPNSRYDAIPLTFTELSGVDSITRSKVCDSNSVQGT